MLTYKGKPVTLTQRQAIYWFRRQWREVAEGKAENAVDWIEKSDWGEDDNYRRIHNYCFLCTYDEQQEKSSYCLENCLIKWDNPGNSCTSDKDYKARNWRAVSQKQRNKNVEKL